MLSSALPVGALDVGRDYAPHAGQHVPDTVARHRFGHPGPPGLRLGEARPGQLQPAEERLDHLGRVVMPGRGGVFRR